MAELVQVGQPDFFLEIPPAASREFEEVPEEKEDRAAVRSNLIRMKPLVETERVFTVKVAPPVAVDPRNFFRLRANFRGQGGNRALDHGLGDGLKLRPVQLRACTFGPSAAGPDEAIKISSDIEPDPGGEQNQARYETNDGPNRQAGWQ